MSRRYSALGHSGSAAWDVYSLGHVLKRGVDEVGADPKRPWYQRAQWFGRVTSARG
jgi:hypothetical protein